MVADFEDYGDLHDGVTADTIRAAAEDPAINSNVVNALADDLGRDGQATAAAVEGAIEEGTTANPEQAQTVARNLAQNGYYAVGLLNRLATDVDTFDTAVAGLNERLHQQTQSILTAERHDPDVRNGDVEGRTYDEIKASVKASLKGEYDPVRRTMEDAVDATATDFEKGPSPERAKELMLAGFIPMSHAGLWPTVQFTDSERRQALENGAEATARDIMYGLISEGKLDGPVDEDDLYFRWLVNSGRRGVDYDTITEIIDDHDIDPDDFDVLEPMTEYVDRDGKSFFLMPDDISGDDARRATVMTYIFNAGTDYGTADDYSSTDNNFEETPYSSEEIQRILDRQDRNDWSYDEDVSFVHNNGGRMVTTPNGMMMGLGGNWLQDLYSQKGGTTYGDIFMVNIDDPDNATQTLQEIVESGVKPTDEGAGSPGSLDLDRLLHHEERHSQQWADEGYTKFLASYAWEQLTGGNQTEEGAGLEDGGYR